MMEFLSIFLGGQHRIVLPSYELLLLASIPPILLALLITTTRLQNIKQILSIPLLIAVFFIPFGFTNGNRLIDLALGCTNYNLFLRFLELFWIGPIVQHRPVYTTTESLWIDFWGCLRTFPKPDKEGKVKEYKKDKKFYHIILYLCTHMVLTDLISSWVCTFNAHEASSMRVERPILYFWYFLACNLLLNSAFNSIGYGLQLFYCIFFEKGSYSSEQWRPLMLNPVLSNSLDDLWSRRWHSLFKSTWLAFPFRPVRVLVLRFLAKYTKHAKTIAFVAASLSVFLASGMMHEYVIAANMGWSLYHHFFIGEQIVFFMLHGLGVLLEPALPKNTIIRHTWVFLFGYMSFYYILHGFITWGFQLDNFLTFSKPYLVQFIDQHPTLLSYVGSLK